MNDNQSDDNFTQQEITTIKYQLDQLETLVSSFIAKHTETTQAQEEYLRASFTMLNEKLDKSGKESWRQTAYGVVASVACTFMPDVQTAQSFFQTAGSFLSSIPNLLISK